MSRLLRAAVCALLMVPAPAAFAQLPQDIQGQGIQVEDILDTQGTLAPVAQRAFLLVFDYPLGGLRQEEEVTAAVQSWISSELQPADLVAVASYYGSALQAQQDFTADRDVLASAVADAVKGRPRESVLPPAGTPSLLARLPQGEELRQRTTSFYGVLQVLAEASDGAVGRKDMLVFSKGFGRSHSDALGSDTIVAALDFGLAERLPTFSGASESVLVEKYLANRELYEPTLQALKLHDVALYPVDLATDYRDTFPLAGVMSQLAGATGGRYLYPANDLPKLFSRILEDGPRLQKPAEARIEQAAGGAAGRRDVSKSADE